ncbi:hypothetical protein DFH09DRAFT_1169725 [Mycena vulgaris]|nr:hypothetical protein DFH09DRAFT_1169725 [Mycena vulgaris]
MRTSLIFVAVLATVANADHRITLRVSAVFNVPHNGVDHSGPAVGDIPAHSSKDITVPTSSMSEDSQILRWNGKSNQRCLRVVRSPH